MKSVYFTPGDEILYIDFPLPLPYHLNWINIPLDSRLAGWVIWVNLVNLIEKVNCEDFLHICRTLVKMNKTHPSKPLKCVTRFAQQPHCRITFIVFTAPPSSVPPFHLTSAGKPFEEMRVICPDPDSQAEEEEGRGGSKTPRIFFYIKFHLVPLPAVVICFWSSQRICDFHWLIQILAGAAAVQHAWALGRVCEACKVVMQTPEEIPPPSPPPPQSQQYFKLAKFVPSFGKNCRNPYFK